MRDNLKNVKHVAIHGGIKMMDDLEIDRHILRAVYELKLIYEEYDSNRDEYLERQEILDDIIETLLYNYPGVEDELEKETWK